MKKYQFTEEELAAAFSAWLIDVRMDRNNFRSDVALAAMSAEEYGRGSARMLLHYLGAGK